MYTKTLTEKEIRSFYYYLKEEERSKATLEKYIRDVRSFVFFLDHRELTKELTIEYKQYLLEQGYAVASVNSMLAAVNCFVSFLGYGNCKVKQLKVQRQTYCPEEKELTKEEYFRLVEEAKKKKNGRLSVLLQTICGVGIRISELSYFTVESVRTGKISVSCKNKTRTILMPRQLKKLLLEYAKKAGIKTGMIFVTRNGKPLNRSNIWSEMKALCKRANVSEKKVFPHNLRKLFARTFYTVEKDIAKLADILGHSNINTTRIYIISTGKEHRRKIERLGLVV